MSDWYNPFSWGKQSPQEAGDKAAGQVRQIGDQAMGLAGQSWNQQMGGLDRALGAYANSNLSIGRYASGASNPGYAENGFNAYGSNYLQPGTQSSLYGGLSQRYGSTPTNSQGAYNNLPNTFGPNNSQQVFNGMYSGPSYQQGAFNAVGSNLLSPSQQQQGYSNTYGSIFSGQGQGENYSDQNRGYFASPGQLEQQSGSLANRALGSSGQAQTAFDTSARAFTNNGFLTDQATAKNNNLAQKLSDDITASDRRYGQDGQLAGMQGDISKAYNSANDVQGFAQRQGGNFEKQGMGEQFAQNFLDQSNPYQEREQKKLTDAMNQQFAARGVFNSGGAIAGLGNALGEFQAQNYKNMADVSAQGEQMQMQRLGQGQGLAQAASGEKQALGSNLQGLGQGLSQEWLGRDSNRIQNSQELTNNALGLMGMNLQGANQGENARMQGMNSYLSAAGQAGQASLAGANSAAGILGNSQGAGLSRVMGGGQLADAAQGMSLQRANSGMNALSGIDASTLSRALGYGNLAQGADTGRNSISDLLLRGGSAADSTSNSRAGLTLQGAGQADNAGTDRDRILSGLAGGADQTRMSGLNGYFGAANGIDTFKDQQQVKILASSLGVDDATASKILQFYQQGGQFQGDMQNTGLGAYGNAAGLQLQGALGDYQGATNLFGTALGAGIGASGGGGGGKK